MLARKKLLTVKVANNEPEGDLQQIAINKIIKTIQQEQKRQTLYRNNPFGKNKKTIKNNGNSGSRNSRNSRNKKNNNKLIYNRNIQRFKFTKKNRRNPHKSNMQNFIVKDSNGIKRIKRALRNRRLAFPIAHSTQSEFIPSKQKSNIIYGNSF
jgi:hypothetical protein